MRVIMINAVYGLASTGRTVKQLDEGLVKYGMDSTTVYFSGPGTGRDYQMNTLRGVKLHSLLARLTGKSGYYSALATKRLLRYLDEQKPDIVHLHNLHSNFICLPKLFGYLAKNRIPLAVTLHDCWWFTGKCTHYTVDGCSGWQHGCGNCRRLKKDIPSWFFDRTETLLSDKQKWFGSVHPLAVIGVSDWITGEAKKSFLGKAEIIKRVYNWIDTEAFMPVESELPKKYGLDGKFIMLAVAAQWMDSKGLSAFARLSRSLPGDMAIVMIGRLPQGDTVDLSGITLIPETHDQHELAEWYSSADVLLSLSKEESFGKVTAEALACGTPVISLNSTASPELVGDNCGLVIDSDDPETVLAAVAEIRAQGKASMSAGCRKFALENFGMEDNIAAIADIYRKLDRIKREGR